MPALRWFPDRPGGSSYLACGHARHLSQLGHEVWVLALAASENAPELEIVDGIRILRYQLPRRAWFDPRRPYDHGAAAGEVLARHGPPAFDAIHGHTLFAYAKALDAFPETAITSLSLHSPVRLEYRASARLAGPLAGAHLSVAGRLLSRLERRCLERSRVVTAFSDYTRSLIRTLHGPALADRTVIIPGWVDESRFAPAGDRDAVKRRLGLPPDRPVLFSLRRLVPRMGLDNLLKAASKLKRSRSRLSLVIGGDGPLRGRLEELTASLGLREDVLFLGRVEESVLPRYYEACDAFVLPTAELECFGLIAVEAMAAGRPVLATPVGAIPEVVGRIEPAWLARDASAEALEELLRRFVSNELPPHDPDALSAAVKGAFGSKAVLPKLVSTTLGAGRAEA